MSVHLDRFKLSYFPVPKVACSSIKHWLFQIENGFEFKAFRANGRLHHIHDTVYPTRAFERIDHSRTSDHVRLTLIRDPVERFLSCYANRVLQYRDLGPQKARNGFPPDPDLNLFIDLLEEYREANASIRHHTDPMTVFLGTKIGYFDAIYPLVRVDAFVDRVRRITDSILPFPHLQRARRKIVTADLSERQLQRLRGFYECDYEVFGDLLESSRLSESFST